MREWSREEKYRYLKDPQELTERYRRSSASAVMRLGVRLPWTGEMKNTFNPEEGFSRARPLEAGLNHLRIFTDASSVEIFVNDGDAVFTSRVFPSESEHWFTLHGDVFPRLWTIRQAVKDSFLI